MGCDAIIKNNDTKLYLLSWKYVLKLLNDKNKSGNFLEVCENINNSYPYEKRLALHCPGFFFIGIH